MPKHIWDDTRRKELEKVIERYIDSDRMIPIDWVNELNELRRRDDEKQESFVTITLSEYERLKSNYRPIQYGDNPFTDPFMRMKWEDARKPQREDCNPPKTK